MVHLPIHLVSEAKVAGPMQYRWMYPIERYLRTLKSYVRNKSRPEGSIAEGEHKQSIRVKPHIRARDVDLIYTREFISWFEECKMSHRRGRVQIVSLEDELDNLQQLLDMQPAATTTPSSFDPSNSSYPSVVDEERLCHRPPHLSDDDWRWLIHFWGTPEAKAQKNEDRSEPNRIETFALTHTRKDGTPVDDHSKEIMDQFQQLLSQPEGTSSSTSASSGASTSVSSTSIASTYVDEIYT
ncbi:hypothetical protein CK203_036938 [Vitis vinifera]|uniref:DUF4218 domain-containing protein n=1 Tax=Vitis vinifera TaxID=29760 RepID=A0A438IV39_VITVI|nr:hypothetical protein CK203_036938 [Vitis vinifera]